MSLNSNARTIAVIIEPADRLTSVFAFLCSFNVAHWCQSNTINDFLDIAYEFVVQVRTGYVQVPDVVNYVLILWECISTILILCDFAGDPPYDLIYVCT